MLITQQRGKPKLPHATRTYRTNSLDRSQIPDLTVAPYLPPRPIRSLTGLYGRSDNRCTHAARQGLLGTRSVFPPPRAAMAEASDASPVRAALAEVGATVEVPLGDDLEDELFKANRAYSSRGYMRGQKRGHT